MDEGIETELRALFGFNKETPVDEIVYKFNLFARYFFVKYFTSEDAPFHKEIDKYNVQIYKGMIPSFLNIAFRGAAKTARTKLFRAFVICNDEEHYRKYMKVLTADGGNSKQIVTDIYNMLVNPRIVALYPEVFAKTFAKREETMSSFTTTTGVKVIADTVGTDQRGAIQEETRPDEIWFEDFETRKILRSAVTLKAIWDNMEEARTGLAKGGGAIYTCNYISERGNVHKLVLKLPYQLIVPIIENGCPAWPARYSVAEIAQILKEAEDPQGEFMCKPSASLDVLFDRAKLDLQVAIEPVEERAGLKIFREYDPENRVGSGHDVAGGVGLDSSTSVFIDFDCVPAQVIGTYRNNTIKPDAFGYEIAREGHIFGDCLVAPEQNNHGHATIAILKQVYPQDKIYRQIRDESKISEQSATDFGWHTNALTKPKMLLALAKAIENGLISLNDKDLIQELKSYTRDDLMDSSTTDPRLTTRHFDLLIACAIAWQTKDFTRVKGQGFNTPNIHYANITQRRQIPNF